MSSVYAVVSLSLRINKYGIGLDSFTMGETLHVVCVQSMWSKDWVVETLEFAPVKNRLLTSGQTYTSVR